MGGPFQARRYQVLSSHIAGLLPHGASVLDVGCGNGHLSSLVRSARPDITILGAEVISYPSPQIPTMLFDGRRLPCSAGAVDVVTLVDVLHHTCEPVAMLREAARVARERIIIKDHLAVSAFDRALLALIDWSGNALSGIPMPFSYWSREQWREAFGWAGLRERSWTEDLPLYRGWAPWLVGRSLHFVAEVGKAR
ncbi:MAG: methyltransferase domain-containing protein [Chloroflexota bacterium]